MYKICLHNRNQTLQINFIQCYASVFLKNRLTAIAGIKTISMIQSLRIIKELFEDEIELQPTMVDDERVIDVMMWLKADKKTERYEYHHVYDLQEVEIIRDFLTTS